MAYALRLHGLSAPKEPPPPPCPHRFTQLVGAMEGGWVLERCYGCKITLAYKDGMRGECSITQYLKLQWNKN